MKKLFAVIFVFCLMANTKVFADSSATTTPGVSGSSTPTNSSTVNKHHKKTTTQTTPTTTLVVTPIPTMSSTKKTTSVPIFSSNIQLYDRIGAPGDLRQAVALAAKAPGSSKHDRSVFLWLGKVTGGDQGKTSYVHFEIGGIELGGPRKPWIVFTGTVDDQSGSECKAGDPIEVAVDFRDVKVDYEGTKLGEIQKGNDIADQFYELLATHSSYQWVLLAQERVKDSQSMGGTATFVAKAKEGYVFLEPLDSHR